MGNQQTKADSSFRPGDWTEVESPDANADEAGHYAIVKNRVTGELLDRYLLQFANEEQYNQYLDSVAYRRNEPHIVRVVHYEPKVVKEFCASSYMLNVYLEHCRSRLSDYQDVPYPDYLYCAMAMLDGYRKLFGKVGRFHVSEYQVMIDQEGEVRVWLNSDFSENHAQNSWPQFKQSYNQQYDMVDDIMKIVFENSDKVEGPHLRLEDFYQRQRSTLQQRVGFEQARGIILQYAHANKINIPDIFRSVYDIYQRENNNNDHNFSNDTRSLHQNLRLNSNSGRADNYEPIQSQVHNLPPVNSVTFAGQQRPITEPNNLPKVFANSQASSGQAYLRSDLPVQPGPLFSPPPISFPSNITARPPPPQPQLRFAPITPAAKPSSIQYLPSARGPAPTFLSPPRLPGSTATIYIPPPKRANVGHSYLPPAGMPASQTALRPAPVTNQIYRSSPNINSPRGNTVVAQPPPPPRPQLNPIIRSDIHEEVNEAAVIRELNELHRIQELEEARAGGARNIAVRLQESEDIFYNISSTHGHSQQDPTSDRPSTQQQGTANGNAQQDNGNIFLNFIQQAGQQQARRSGIKSVSKQVYYTLSNQMELDPEIAADIALYAPS